MITDVPCDRTDYALLEILQDDILLIPRPYETLARHLGIPENEVLERIARLLDTGILRSISPVLDSRRIGITASTLVGLHVPEDRISEIVPVINGYSEVSHNFRRDNHYSVWFTISAPDRKRIDSILAGIVHRTGISENDILELRTVRKFKADVRFRLSGEGSHRGGTDGTE